MAYFTIKDYQNALDDTNACIAINEGWLKGYNRKAAALEGLGRLGDAEKV
jgi:stress-induced-phosphoprotein 1